MTLNVSCDVHALPCPTRKLQGVFDVFYLDPKKTCFSCPFRMACVLY